MGRRDLDKDKKIDVSILVDKKRPDRTHRQAVTPEFNDRIEGSEIVAAIEEKDRGWRSKLPALLNDILIALCARRIGATLITYNKDDFRLIHRHTAFSMRILEAG